MVEGLGELLNCDVFLFLRYHLVLCDPSSKNMVYVSINCNEFVMANFMNALSFSHDCQYVQSHNLAQNALGISSTAQCVQVKWCK